MGSIRLICCHRCVFSHHQAGTVITTTERTQANTLAGTMPMAGTHHAAIHAYALTLVPPSIKGPTAPAPRLSPCASHKPHMVVTKIAGKTAATPARSGPPFSAIHTAPPMAPAAMTPRLTIAILPGLDRAFGAGGFLLQARTPSSPIVIVSAMAHSFRVIPKRWMFSVSWMDKIAIQHHPLKVITRHRVSRK